MTPSCMEGARPPSHSARTTVTDSFSITPTPLVSREGSVVGVACPTQPVIDPRVGVIDSERHLADTSGRVPRRHRSSSRDCGRRSLRGRSKRSRRYSSSSSYSSSPEVSRRRRHDRKRRRHSRSPSRHSSDARELVNSLKSLVEGLVNVDRKAETQGAAPNNNQLGNVATTQLLSCNTSIATTSVSEQGQEYASETEYEEPSLPLNYADSIAAVYKLVDVANCPSQPTPKARVKSLIELDEAPVDSSIPTLPHSSTVKAMEDSLDTDSGLDMNKAGSFVSKDFFKRLAPRSYKVHTEHWPGRNPPLDSDAQKVGVRTPCPPNIPPSLAESLESRSRAMVTMTSHLDLFLAALSRGLHQEESFETLLVLLQSAAKAGRHLMGSAMSISTDLLLCRRDAAIGTSLFCQVRERRVLGLVR